MNYSALNESNYDSSVESLEDLWAKATNEKEL